ncbi:hypothetical protein Lbir_2817 [Legionella birminghamensis]|uniref:Uncharacterized protein n=1 Tax=Legionella birminghamensis TaxID=28083 RepID=A0A378IFT0_9GAMM|nr:hypothetical protein Lbir_2817 [Legionella birminghamensis]STX31074.1 Uncharacterised protein [Legionella birminghamensis]
MSTKTVSQMEAVLMDKIQKAKAKLDLHQQRHQLNQSCFPSVKVCIGVRPQHILP